MSEDKLINEEMESSAVIGEEMDIKVTHKYDDSDHMNS